jgi:hypothetical protein
LQYAGRQEAAYQAHAEIAARTMTKRDNEKDPERPHYYSQFWLDVAAGRRIIGASKPSEEGEQAETELDAGSDLAAIYASNGQQSGTSPHAIINGRADGVISSENEADLSTDEAYAEPEEDLDLTFADLEVEDQELAIEDTDIPDMDFSIVEEDEEYLDEEEEQPDLESLEETEDVGENEDEEDDVGWGRGRKKPKPSRPVKTPTKKPPKRDARRGGY